MNRWDQCVERLEAQGWRVQELETAAKTHAALIVHPSALTLYLACSSDYQVLELMSECCQSSVTSTAPLRCVICTEPIHGRATENTMTALHSKDFISDVSQWAEEYTGILEGIVLAKELLTIFFPSRAESEK